MNIYLEKVENEKKDILYRLLEYSLYEESLNDGNEMNDEGVFVYNHFEDYFNEDDRHAFFIKEIESNKLLGFVMINKYVQKVDDGHSIAEYMVIPKYRKNHIGKKVAFECFDMFPGYWEVSPSFGSESAYLFWNKVINEYTEGNNKFDDGIFIFENKIKKK
ncbi:MAG: GNAT family N-acetyltransferase [Bacilli bacterium]|nr:GNAT family N-acetyltransferase [Bacilli bacterium]